MSDKTKLRIEQIEHKMAMCDEVAYVDHEYCAESVTTYSPADQDMKWLIEEVRKCSTL